MEFLFANAAQFEFAAIQLSFDLTLARGLHYYTGTLFEVSAPEKVQLGAIGGGGRYDNLTEAFGGTDMSGVGISFGLDRLYLVLEDLGLFGEYLEDQIDVVVLFFEHTDPLLLFQVVNRLRAQGLTAEMYPEAAKIAKQYKYAEKRKARFIFSTDQKNSSSKPFVLKNMKTSELHECSLESLQDVIQLIRLPSI